jgi:hypothetical protein
MMNGKEKLIQILVERDEFVTMDDGYVCWWPTHEPVTHPDGGMTGGGGALAAWQLKTIAEELDRRNAEWDKIIQNDSRI